MNPTGVSSGIFMCFSPSPDGFSLIRAPASATQPLCCPASSIPIPHLQASPDQTLVFWDLAWKQNRSHAYYSSENDLYFSDSKCQKSFLDVQGGEKEVSRWLCKNKIIRFSFYFMLRNHKAKTFPASLSSWRQRKRGWALSSRAGAEVLLQTGGVASDPCETPLYPWSTWWGPGLLCPLLRPPGTLKCVDLNV